MADNNINKEDLEQAINECVKTIDQQINRSWLKDDVGDRNFEKFNDIFNQMKDDLAKESDINKKSAIISKAAEELDKELKVFSKKSSKGTFTKIGNLLKAAVEVIRSGGSEQAFQKLEDAARVLDGDRMERVNLQRSRILGANKEQKEAVGKHSERVLGQSQDDEDRAIVGKHTQNLSKESDPLSKDQDKSR